MKNRTKTAVIGVDHKHNGAVCIMEFVPHTARASFKFIDLPSSREKIDEGLAALRTTHEFADEVIEAVACVMPFNVVGLCFIADDPPIDDWAYNPGYATDLALRKGVVTAAMCALVDESVARAERDVEELVLDSMDVYETAKLYAGEELPRNHAYSFLAAKRALEESGLMCDVVVYSRA